MHHRRHNLRGLKFGLQLHAEEVIYGCLPAQFLVNENEEVRKKRFLWKEESFFIYIFFLTAKKKKSYFFTAEKK